MAIETERERESGIEWDGTHGTHILAKTITPLTRSLIRCFFACLLAGWLTDGLTHYGGLADLFGSLDSHDATALLVSVLFSTRLQLYAIDAVTVTTGSQRDASYFDLNVSRCFFYFCAYHHHCSFMNSLYGSKRWYIECQKKNSQWVVSLFVFLSLTIFSAILFYHARIHNDNSINEYLWISM